MMKLTKHFAAIAAALMITLLPALTLALAGCSAATDESEPAAYYRITLLPAGDYTFPDAIGTNYTAPEAYEILIKNGGNQSTGRLTVTLSGDNADSFVLSKVRIASIAADGTGDFTVAPAPGLDTGTYTATVTVSGTAADLTRSIAVSFTVKASDGPSEEDSSEEEPSKEDPAEEPPSEEDTSGEDTSGEDTSGEDTSEEDTSGEDTSETAPVYSVTLSGNGASIGADYTHPFGTVTLPNYTQPASLSVTITNTGNQPTGALTVALGGTNNTSFTVAPTTITGIAANGGTAPFTVVPNTGLAAGTHTATVSVTGGNGISATFGVSFYVIAATYGVTLSRNGAGLGADYTHPFGTVTLPNYTQPASLSVTVTNTGNRPTGNLTVALTGATPSAFTASPGTITSIAVNGSDTFTVAPKTDLAEGTYAAIVTVSGIGGTGASNIETRSFGVSFVVNPPPISEKSYLMLTDGTTTVEFGLSDLSALCTSTGADASITINGHSIVKNTIKKVVIGAAFASVSALPDNFCRGFSNLTELDIRGFTGLTSIGNYFLLYCAAFNQPLTIPSTVTSIGASFLYGCTAFDQPLTLPSGLTSIDAAFLDNCESFNQPLVIPEGVTSIGADFLNNCTSFNQPLAIPEGVTIIDNYFLLGCTSFNQPLVIPEGITSIGYNFMNYCYAFNQLLVIPESVTSIGLYFLYRGFSFNQPLVIPEGVTSIDQMFLLSCDSFVSTVTVRCLATAFVGGGSFAAINAEADCYTKGIKIAGPYTADIIALFPNKDSVGYYRKLIAAQ